ncbi:hypothetical protein EP10_001091 [Geobacillus icigianus]|uniref:Uncharacterized protein n=1 Tax=Geobacillus icigianus TaxID=1430331 RepID=A0ABU6BE76_9BACL|nr:hypothetical protein [Geobacillus icigianus]
MAASNRGCASASDPESELNDQQASVFSCFPNANKLIGKGVRRGAPFFAGVHPGRRPRWLNCCFTAPKAEWF